MPRWIAAFLIFALCATAAHAQNGKRVVLLSSGVPSWVLRAGGAPANIDLNFATGQYYGCTLTSCLSITRASSKTDLLPSSSSGFAYNTFSNNVLAITPTLGLLIEEARTNQLLNSTVPATQTTGSLANGAYTLWVNGSGSAQMSLGTGVGCGVGAATNGTPVNFTISTPGTCIVTVTGSLNAFQLELGAFGTSLIVTAGATATRAADLVQFAGTLNAIIGATQGSWYNKTSSLSNVSNGVIVSRRVSIDKVHVSSATTAAITANSGDRATATVGSGSYATGSVGTVNTWSASGGSLVAKGGTVSTTATPYTTFFSGTTGLGSDQSIYQNGYTQRFAGFSTTLSNPIAQTLSLQ